MSDRFILPNGDAISSLEVEEVGVDDNYYRVGDWSFDLRDEGDPEEILSALAAWYSWYLFVLNRKKQN